MDEVSQIYVHFNFLRAFLKNKICHTVFGIVLHSDLVDKFECNICHGIYYSKTKGHFKVKACKHLGIMPLTVKKSESSKERAVFDHVVHTSHNAGFYNFETLVKDCDEIRIMKLESFLILPDDPHLNRYVNSIYLELFSSTT